MERTNWSSFGFEISNREITLTNLANRLANLLRILYFSATDDVCFISLRHALMSLKKRYHPLDFRPATLSDLLVTQDRHATALMQPPHRYQRLLFQAVYHDIH